MRYSFDGAASRYYFDGLAGVGAPANQEIVETYNSGGNDFKDNKTKRRYIRLPGSVDEVLLMREYDSAGTLTAIRYVHANRLGSVVALTTTSGYAIDKYAYSPYGEAGVGGSSGFPFRFTGQKLFASVDLYYYKARWYDPETGRFMQTDPIGYEDQMNLYAYVGNDPINATDPTGQCQDSVCMNERRQEAMTSAGRASAQHIAHKGGRAVAAAVGVGSLFLPGPEDAILAVAGVRLASTRVLLAGIRAQFRSGKQLVLYSGKVPELKKGEFAFRTRDLFWTKGVNDKVIKEAIKTKRPIRDSHVNKDGSLKEAKPDGVLERERKQLEDADWSFNQETGNWEPPTCSTDRLVRSSC